MSLKKNFFFVFHLSFFSFSLPRSLCFLRVSARPSLVIASAALSKAAMTDTPPGGGPQLPPRWGAALGNIADAAVRAETLGDAVDKALWLDEAALEAAAPPQRRRRGSM